MAPSAEGPRGTRGWLWVLGLLIAGLIGGVGWVQWRQSVLMSQASLVGGDNMVHFLYQADTEYLRLRESWPRPATLDGPPPDLQSELDGLQLRYEIFVSRIGLLKNALKQHDLSEKPEVVDAVARAEAFIARADPLFETGRGLPHRDEVTAVYAELRALGEVMQRLTREASRLINVYGTRVSEAGRVHNQLGIAMSLLLSLLALAFTIFSLRQLKRLQQRRQQLEQLTEELAAARLAAESASQAKGAFLANMSHEIRTPFQGLVGMLRLLGQTPLDDEQAGFLRTARTSADHLLTLLNDVLDMSRLESGRMTLSPGPVELRVLLSDIDALMRPQAEGKGLRFDLQIDDTLPQTIACDVTRVRQIIFNLVSNAIKFTERGHVTVRASVAPISHPDDLPGASDGLRLAVIDTGIGIDEATLSRLFERFSQGDPTRARRYGGTGLGLEISRSLARLMGGDLQASSVPGQGSEFIFTMPLVPAVELSAPAPDLDSTARETAQPKSAQAAVTRTDAVQSTTTLGILVADDNEVNRMVMAAILSGMGHHSSFAVDGRQALEMASTQSWDLILMDLHMPEMDGIEATRSIRQLDDSQRASVPIVALTADVFPETRQQCLEAGITDFLTKPVDHDALQAVLARISRRAVDRD